MRNTFESLGWERSDLSNANYSWESNERQATPLLLKVLETPAYWGFIPVDRFTMDCAHRERLEFVATGKSQSQMQENSEK
jgi:hypothetical protein